MPGTEGSGSQKRVRAALKRPLEALAVPGMYLVYKYSQYKRQQQETSRRRVTEKELQNLNQKIVSLIYLALFITSLC